MTISTSNIVLSYIVLIWLNTFFMSILIVLCGKNIFKRASKGEKTALYPVINLFTMLEISDTSTFLGILFFVPILNLIVISIMSYRLGGVFGTGLFFKIGLIVCPIIFYPLLSRSDKPYKLSDQEYFKVLNNLRSENINLMTQEEIELQNQEESEDDNVEVDSIFKSNIQMMEKVAPYKAAKIDLLGMTKLRNDEHDKMTSSELLKKEEPKEEIEMIDL